MKEREHKNERECVWKGSHKQSENSATDNRDNYCTQTEEEMMDQTRYHFGAPLSPFTYLFFSSLFLPSLYPLSTPTTTPGEHFPPPPPLIVTRFVFISPFNLFNFDTGTHCWNAIQHCAFNRSFLPLTHAE